MDWQETNAKMEVEQRLDDSLVRRGDEGMDGQAMVRMRR